VIKSQKGLMAEGRVKTYAWMLLQGVAFMHSKSIIHRVRARQHPVSAAMRHVFTPSLSGQDLKPSNLLISSDGVLKIGDFGLARAYSEPQLESYSHQVATRQVPVAGRAKDRPGSAEARPLVLYRWYRAPELLFGSRRYGLAVDMWAVGLIIGELYNMNPLFPGNNDIDQIFKVLQILGTPTQESWPVSVVGREKTLRAIRVCRAGAPAVRQTATDLPDFNKVVFPEMPAVKLEDAFPRIPRGSVKVIESMVVLEPSRRSSAVQVRSPARYCLWSALWRG
jgi:cell cycle related kinase